MSDGLKESKEKNMKEQWMSDMRSFRNAIYDMADELDLDLDVAIELYKAFQLFCIHQHLEQLVYKK